MSSRHSYRQRSYYKADQCLITPADSLWSKAGGAEITGRRHIQRLVRAQNESLRGRTTRSSKSSCACLALLVTLGWSRPPVLNQPAPNCSISVKVFVVTMYCTSVLPSFHTNHCDNAHPGPPTNFLEFALGENNFPRSPHTCMTTGNDNCLTYLLLLVHFL